MNVTYKVFKGVKIDKIKKGIYFFKIETPLALESE